MRRVPTAGTQPGTTNRFGTQDQLGVQIDPVDREQESRFSTLDSFVGTRETNFVLAPGASRKQIA